MTYFLKKIIFLTMLCLFSLTTNKAYASEYSDYSFTTLLPINHFDTNNAISLSLTSPKGYRCLQSMQDINNGSIVEFIPKTDNNEYQWSEIITFDKIVGNGIKAAQMIQLQKDNFNKATTEVKIVKDLKEEKNGYETSTLVLSYKVNGRREVIMMKYYSGPADLGGV